MIEESTLFTKITLRVRPDLYDWKNTHKTKMFLQMPHHVNGT